LATVYQYKLRLQQLWSRSHQSHEALLKGLSEWCAQAEATGIQVLESFAQRLRGFSVVHPAI
ncbi:MAG: transposase, partial [Ectothiorhodospiraceae bacterium]